MNDYGRCLPQCISHITGIPDSNIPHFCFIHGDDWLVKTSQWLEENGFLMMYVPFMDNGDIIKSVESLLCERQPYLPFIISGNIVAHKDMAGKRIGKGKKKLIAHAVVASVSDGIIYDSTLDYPNAGYSNLNMIPHTNKETKIKHWDIFLIIKDGGLPYGTGQDKAGRMPSNPAIRQGGE